MESAKEIITHLKDTPLFKCINDNANFFKLLQPKDQKLISFMYIKDNLLMIALKHNLGLQELKKDSNIKDIKELLKIFTKFNPNSDFTKVTDVKFFLARKYKVRDIFTTNIIIKETKKEYFERSNGKFKNKIKDKKIHDIFEEIRELILANR